MESPKKAESELAIWQLRNRMIADFHERYSGVLRPEELFANVAEFERFCDHFRARYNCTVTNAMIRAVLWS